MYSNKRGSPRPLLVLVSRRGNVSRVILNQEEVIKVAKEVGFNVHVLEPSRDSNSMANAYRLIHASHVMLGVHGAGLTHSLFLRQGSVLVQVGLLERIRPQELTMRSPLRFWGWNTLSTR